jgi:hypothetical protein
MFETSKGRIPVSGSFDGRPKVLAITGAWAPPNEMSLLHRTIPDYDALVARLPGNGTPHLAETSIPAWAVAYGEVVDQIGPAVLLGLSVGALVALGIRSENLRAIVAVDPPLATSKLWPMTDWLRARPPEDRAMVEHIFGVYPDRVEERHYLTLLDGVAAPLHSIVGSRALFPQRPLDRMPSLVDEPERRALAVLGPLTVGPNSGHNVPFYAGPTLLGVLRETCAQALPAE